MSIGEGEDSSACLEMIGSGDALFVVKEKSIWKVVLADGIDPERKNPRLPNMQQKFSSLGAESPIVQRTLLQAKYFLEKGSFPSHVDLGVALKRSIEIVVELERVEGVSAALASDLSQARDKLNRATDKRTLGVPHFPRLEDHWSTLIDASDAARKCIRDIAFSFYPDLKRSSDWFDDLRSRIVLESFEDKDHSELLEVVNHDLGFVRWLRNAKEHAKEGQSATLHNYRLLQHGAIAPPSVTIVKKGEQPSEIDLSDLARQVLNALMFCYEMCLIWNCASNVLPVLDAPLKIARMADDERYSRRRGFCYVVEMGGQVAVLG